MVKLLEKLGYDFLRESYPLPESLARLLESTLISSEGCVLLAAISQPQRIQANLSEQEKCELEYFENHFHPDEHVAGARENEVEYLCLALESAKRLANRLAEEAPQHTFRITASFSPTLFQGEEIEVVGSSAVRFYCVRPAAEEAFWIDNLEQFNTEAVMEIEV